jgi:phosphoglycolate phosphatase
VKLILFDIDGTILWTDGAGRRAMESALSTVFGSRGAPGYHYDGKTDRQIIRELMRGEGHDDGHIDRHMMRSLDQYLDCLTSELETGQRAPRCLDGVVELIEALEKREDRVVGLLTGNLERGAAAKLRAVGLDPSRFVIAAYGSDHEIRAELPAIAQQRARDQLGLHLDGTAILIIGDTPDDINCARAIDARAIAVATGRFSVDDLRAYEPYAVFPDLTDTRAVMRAIDDA